MADINCPRCGKAAAPTIRFCRDCGARLGDSPGPETKTGSPGDETLIAGAPGRASPPTATSDIDAGDKTVMAGMHRPPGPPPGEEPGKGSGTETLVGGFVEEGEAAPPKPKGPPPGFSGDRTQVAGARAPAPPPAPPPGKQGPADDASIQVTMAGSPPGGKGPAPPPFRPAPPPPPRAAPPPAFRPAPPPPPPEEPEEPVEDSFDDDASGATLAAPGFVPAPAEPAPPPPAPRPAPPRAPAPPGSGASLVHWSPRVKEQPLRLEKPEVLVGRDKGDLRFPEDDYLSRKHARLVTGADGSLTVEDLGTLNGTYIRVRGPTKLENRDVLAIGRHVFRFELLKYEEADDRTIEGDPLTRVQGVRGTAPRARLVKRQAEGFSGMQFLFGTRPYVLGRTEGTHRFTGDDLMSRRHVSLEYRDGDYWIDDLGSQNGTYLRLRGPRILSVGDVFRLGDQYFRVV